MISKCEHSPDPEILQLVRGAHLELDDTESRYLSPVFTRPKKDGTNRMILNLKGLNSEITYHHFKMDTL